MKSRRAATTIVMSIVAALAIGISLSGCASTGLSQFGADIGRTDLPVIDPIRVPYTYTVKYFGYIKPGSSPDEDRDGKKFYYLYLWVPAVAPEIGVRMLSPVRDLAKPKEGDIISPFWEEGSKDTENYFDTYITFERSLDITSVDDIEAKIGSTQWVQYDSNDDSSEMPPQPSGSRYNSLLRITSSPSDPLKALVVGLYRIGFTTFKVGEVQGTFYAEVGAPVNLPGTAIAKEIPDLIKILKGGAM
jgi:hypothetical protein